LLVCFFVPCFISLPLYHFLSVLYHFFLLSLLCFVSSSITLALLDFFFFLSILHSFFSSLLISSVLFCVLCFPYHFLFIYFSFSCFPPLFLCLLTRYNLN
jgi:hypothetical protein